MKIRSSLSKAIRILLPGLSLFVLLGTLHGVRAAEVQLNFESDPIFQPLLNEFEQPGSNAQAYLLSERYRLDLSILDLIDQGTEIAKDFPGVNEALRAALGPDPVTPDFRAWRFELKKQADRNPRLAKLLDRKLHSQLYSSTGIALLPEYKFIDIQKIKDNGRLERIRKYNLIANDPEGTGLLLAFSRGEHPGFHTRPLTVAKFSSLKFKEFRKLRRSYYKQLVSLHKKHDPELSITFNRHGLQALSRGDSTFRSVKIFNILQTLPGKYETYAHLMEKVPGIPVENGIPILTPVFIERNFTKIEQILKEYTLSKYVDSLDDRYLLSVRNYLKNEHAKIERDLLAYNQANRTELKLTLSDKNKKPSRLDALSSHATLVTLYPEMPWLTQAHGVLINRKGREVFIHKNEVAMLGHFFSRLARELAQTETYLSLLAGGTTLVLAPGNIPLAMSTQKLVKRAVKTVRYDREFEEFLKAAPGDVINALLWGSGLSAGRAYKIIALGAGQGFIQSLVTGQDLRTGATVGAALSVVQYYALPRSIGRPIAEGVDHSSLVRNRALELLEKSVRGAAQGATVAALEGEAALRGALKGTAYALVSTPVLIWLLGTRYHPFKDYDPAKVDEAIRLENEYQNSLGRGGHYEIDRQLILDANYRRGGIFPEIEGASITLPGSITMSSVGYRKLLTMTHEASHLMQQHQSGVFGFYLFRYLPEVFKTGPHPDENYMDEVLKRF